MLNYYYKESSYNSNSCVILQLKLINKLLLSVCLFTPALYLANQESIFAMTSYTIAPSQKKKLMTEVSAKEPELELESN